MGNRKRSTGTLNLGCLKNGARVKLNPRVRAKGRAMEGKWARGRRRGGEGERKKGGEWKGERKREGEEERNVCPPEISDAF